MIIKAHDEHYKKILEHITFPMLMLGNQRVENGYDNPFDWDATLDPDGGNIQVDLSGPLPAFTYGSVINIGTTEHIWDIHGAYCNVARILYSDGVFAGVTPCEGYNKHGIHTTRSRYIRDFFILNGFDVIDDWHSKEPNGTLYWIIAQKNKNVDTFMKPQQVFKGGQAVKNV